MRQLWTIAVMTASVAVVTTVLSPSASADGGTPPTGVMDIAHRGAALQAPEHTLAALDQAVAVGADRMSIDVRLTADGVPVLLHDDSLARSTDVEQKFPGRDSYLVGAFTLAEIRTLDAGSWFAGGTYTGSRVMTLDEALTELADSPAGLMVEVKHPEQSGGASGVGKAVMDVVDAHPQWASDSSQASPRLVMESFPDPVDGWGFLDAMHDTYPRLPLALLGTVTAADLDAHPFVSEIDVSQSSLTPEVVAAAHDRHLRVGTWTVNATDTIDRVLNDGVDGITTDDPQKVHGILSTGGRSWSATSWAAAPAVAQAALATPRSVLLGGRATVAARVGEAGGAPARWRSVEVQALTNGTWTTVAHNATDSQGHAVSSLRVVDGMRLRAVADGVASAAHDLVIATTPTTLPAAAPGPSLRPAVSPAYAAAGPRPRIYGLSAGVWASMSGRSWRQGCPVGRTGLRVLRVSYWGFDGYRHRGGLMVAARSTTRLARVFSMLYDQRLAVRSLGRVESLGGWSSGVSRSLRSDTTFGFACQRTPGDAGTTGSHARGTVVSLNPWENPSVVRGVGTPDSWWVSRRSLPYVHTSATAVVKAFARYGFAWNGGRRRYAEFRDIG